MDIRQLEAFLAVAEAGSFTTAADRLHTVQRPRSAAAKGASWLWQAAS